MVGATPVAAVTRPDVNGVPKLPDAPAVELIVAGCHGGAGTSTIVGLLSPIARVLDVQTKLGRPNSTPLLVVARGNVGGAVKATEWINAVAGMGVIPTALIVVADTGEPEPKLASIRFRLLEDRLRQGIIRFPYIPRWRYNDPDADPVEHLGRSGRRAVGELHKFASALLQR